MTRKEILQEAEKCVCGKREQDYGSPEDNFSIIADLWSAYTGHSYSPVDVSMMMSLMKIARIRSGGGTGDSFVDLAGYAACGGEIHSKKDAKNRLTTMDESIMNFQTKVTIFTDKECPACGSSKVVKNNIISTSRPPYEGYTCIYCGYKWSER